MSEYDRLFHHPIEKLSEQPFVDINQKSYILDGGFIAFWGTPGSGKTEAANHFEEYSNALILDIDAIRKTNIYPRASSSEPEIEREELREAFSAQREIGASLVAIDGGPILFTSTGRSSLHRSSLATVAAECGEPLVRVVVQNTYEELVKRVLARTPMNTDSNINSVALLDEVIRNTEAYPADAFYIDGRAPLDLVVGQILYHILLSKDAPLIDLINVLNMPPKRFY